MKVSSAFLLIILLLAACTTEAVPIVKPLPTTSPVPTIAPGGFPTIINHERPNIKVDFSPFENVGCDTKEGIIEYLGHTYMCGEQSTLRGKCSSISKSDMLGGLSPSIPVAYCDYIYKTEDVDFSSECFISDVRFVGWDCQRVVIYKNSHYTILKNMKAFRSFFAPVDSSEEALGFALISGYYYARYNHKIQKNIIYYVQTIEDSYIETIADGYIVHLFYTPSDSCGPFNTEAVAVRVTHEGYVDEINRYPIYRDPAYDSVCLD